MGFVRVVAVTSILGMSFLGNVYATANSLPNILFEIVAGGALAAVVVPALTRSLSQDRPDPDAAASALMNSAIAVVTPIVLAGLILRRPLMSLLLSQVDDPDIRASQIELGSFLLLMFLPQIWLYAAGSVLTGFLHTRRRFIVPALAPLLSSIVVIATYVVYSVVDGTRDVSAITTVGKLTLGLGTTAGVAILSLALVAPAFKVGFRWRPVLRIPSDLRAQIKEMLVAAIVGVIAQQTFLAAVVVIANRVEGGVVAYQLAFTLLLLPWAVFAVPIATSFFPDLAAAAARGDVQDLAGRSTRAASRTAWLVFGAAALMVALSRPGLDVLLALAPRASTDASLVIPAVVAFAPGLVGYGSFALLSRMAYATGNARITGTAAILGFGLGIGLCVIAGLTLDGAQLIAGMAAAFSAGTSAASVYVILKLGRWGLSHGVDLFQGLKARVARLLFAGLIAAGSGWGVARLFPSRGLAWDLAAVAAVGGVTAVGYIAVAGRRL